MNWNIEEHIIFEALTGSQLYGTATEYSDKDYRGVCIPPWQIRNHPFMSFDQKDSWEGKYEDRVIYNIKKFFKLCADANPSIIELLFIPEKFWINFKPVWHGVADNYKLFVSKKVKFTFSGYAHSQLQRIKTHRNWLLNPPKEKPTRESFDLPINPAISYEQMSALLTLPEGLVFEEYREEARREKAYRNTKTNWDMY